jgi:hypothetical protein
MEVLSTRGKTFGLLYGLVTEILLFTETVCLGIHVDLSEIYLIR